MTKFQSYLGLFITIVILFSCAILPIQASSQDSDIRTVMISIFVQKNAEIAENEFVDIYLQNTSTGEEFQLQLNGNNTNTPVDLPKGEYIVSKATLSDRPTIAFETSISRLVVDDSENIFFTVSLKNVLTSEENQEEVQNSIDDIKQDELYSTISGIAVFAWLVWLIVIVVYAIRGKFCKDPLKASLLRAIRKMQVHLFISLSVSGVLGSLFGSIDGAYWSWFGAIVGFGLPVGMYVISPFVNAMLANPEETYAAPDTQSNKNIFIIILSLVASALIGILLLPVLLVKDIMDIVKANRNYKEATLS